MAAAIQEFQRSESDRLNEVKGHLEIALLEKHFLPARCYTLTISFSGNPFLSCLSISHPISGLCNRTTGNTEA
ncbi:GRAM domain-containing protein 4-like protein [Lates japonicus]|uniref:GRAM domain-containing protein 4-like protein n=1 Tax=Lates japonicus TaxID=270547 RepID=A0AAD3RBQ5_LATJO|nr:GRAM domain-containing protein 4-like protein [Lates japonicus]